MKDRGHEDRTVDQFDQDVTSQIDRLLLIARAATGGGLQHACKHNHPAYQVRVEFGCDEFECTVTTLPSQFHWGLRI